MQYYCCSCLCLFHVTISEGSEGVKRLLTQHGAEYGGRVSERLLSLQLVIQLIDFCLFCSSLPFIDVLQLNVIPRHFALQGHCSER